MFDSLALAQTAPKFYILMAWFLRWTKSPLQRAWLTLFGIFSIVPISKIWLRGSYNVLRLWSSFTWFSLWTSWGGCPVCFLLFSWSTIFCEFSHYVTWFPIFGRSSFFLVPIQKTIHSAVEISCWLTWRSLFYGPTVVQAGILVATFFRSFSPSSQSRILELWDLNTDLRTGGALFSGDHLHLNC